MTVLVTGGCGFIGSALVRHILEDTKEDIVDVDCMTYAATEPPVNPRHRVFRTYITHRTEIQHMLEDYKPRGIIHLAAETHVDRTIDNPAECINTNINGTYILLEESLRYWRKNPDFRFHYVSTDEVYGSLGPDDPPFTEESVHKPSSPYSASKDAGEMLTLAWGKTYGLPVVVSHAANNFGEFQHPDKLIPLMICKALNGDELPVYGNGLNVRSWCYVEDHAKALWTIFNRGRAGETYNIGGVEDQNINIVKRIRDHIGNNNYIRYVPDRPGHDFRYASSNAKFEEEFGYDPVMYFDVALKMTIDWYMNNRGWWEPRYTGKRIGLNV